MENSRQTNMTILEDRRGNKLEDFNAIEAEIMQFYVDLVGKALNTQNHVDIESLRGGKHMSMESADKLIKHVNKEQL